jgi:hypothetical protein
LITLIARRSFRLNPSELNTWFASVREAVCLELTAANFLLQIEYTVFRISAALQSTTFVLLRSNNPPKLLKNITRLDCFPNLIALAGKLLQSTQNILQERGWFAQMICGGTFGYASRPIPWLQEIQTF